MEKAIKKLIILCKIGNQEAKIETIVMESDIPWILGRNTMSKLGIVIDVQHGEVRMNGKIIACGSDYNDHLKKKLRKRKKELTKE